MGELSSPQRYVVSKPSGDPDAARQLASAYDACADALLAQVRVATGVLDRLGAAWRGTSAHAAQEPESLGRRRIQGGPRASSVCT